MDLFEFEIPESLAGERIDKVVSLLAGCGRAEAGSLIAGGDVLVNGSPPKNNSVRVVAEDVVQIKPLPVRDELPVADLKIDFEVVYENADFLVVNKPVGLVVHPGAGNPDKTLVNGLLARYPEIAEAAGSEADDEKTDEKESGADRQRPGIVHRLDKDTSGLMLVARTRRAYEVFTRALAARQITREYEAVCLGDFQEDKGIIEAPIGRSEKNRTKMAVKKDGKEARTHYEVLARFPDSNATHLKCRLESGRTHQIRVHLSSIGHPILGDALYGGTADTTLALYACRLKFDNLKFGSLESELTGSGDTEGREGKEKREKRERGKDWEGLEGREFHLQPPADFAGLLEYLNTAEGARQHPLTGRSAK